MNNKYKIMNDTEEKQIYVAFHKGRGGRFYNAGFVTYLGEMTLQDLIRRRDLGLSIVEPDDEGAECDVITLYDTNSNPMLEGEEVTSLVGTLDFDGEYDTDSAMLISDCDERSLRIIAQSGEYLSPDLIQYLEDYTDYRFDEKGNLID